MSVGRNTASDLSGPASPIAFLTLTLVVAAPFWLLGDVVDVDIMPGLPLSALMIFAPAIAAFGLRLREAGPAGAAQLAARAIDAPRVRSLLWYAPAILLMPIVGMLAYFLAIGFGADVPPPQIRPGELAALAALFFIAASLEEIGWVGYALDPLQARIGELRAGLVIGVVWVVFHIPALAQVGRSLEWIVWWAIGTLAIRIFMVRLYNAAGGSVFLLSLFHMSQNVAWQAYPVRGSHYDPRLFGVLFVLCAVAAVAMRGRRAKPTG